MLVRRTWLCPRFALTLLSCLLVFTVSVLDSQATNHCYDCHGTVSGTTGDYRPLDAPERTVATGGFQGSHRKHMDSTATPATCSICHPGSADYSASHRNGLITISLVAPAVYRNGSTVFPQTPEPRLGSCTNVSCHSDGTVVSTGVPASAITPAWGSSGLSCAACHGFPPSYPSGQPKANSHQNHRFGCNRCHYQTTTDGTTITSPASHRNGWYNVSGPANEYLYYNGAVCYNSYCHGNGANVATGAAANGNTSPSWGSQGPLPCNSCHGNPPAYAKGSPKANLHLLHNSYNYKCSQCHYATTQNGTSIAAGSTSHANHAYEVSGPPDRQFSYTYAATGGTCTNSYCHSSVQGKADPADPPVYTAPNWSQRYTVRCSRCHKRGYHAGDGYLMDTGSHLKHLKFDSTSHTCRMCHYTPLYGSMSSCSECHNPGTTYIGSNIFTDFSPRGPEHANGVIDVAIHPSFPVAGATGRYSGDTIPGTAYGVCTNLYCHSQGTRSAPPYVLANISTVAWGGSPLPVDCTGCHNGDRNSSRPLATLSHGKHSGYDCSRCHSWTVYNSRSAIPLRQYSDNYPLYTSPSYHADGYVDVMFSNRSAAISGTYAGVANTMKLAGTPQGRCTNVYCHGNGTAVVTRTSYTNISTPIWGTTGRLQCGSCHGFPPAYPDGSPKANGHPQHSADCRICHYQTTTTSTTISDRSKHAQFRYVLDSAPGVTFSYTYAAAGSSCSGVSCHTTGSTPRVWGATSCGNCHLAAPADTSHKKHYFGLDRYAAYGNISSNQLFGYNCGVCHPLDPARDHDGTVQVELYNGAAKAGTVKSFNSDLSQYNSGTTVYQDSRGVFYTNGNCSNIYCHSAGTSSGSTRKPISSNVAWNSGAMWCGSCHYYPPNYPNGTPKANSHERHYSVGNKCQDCHYSVTTNGNTVTNKAQHINNRYELVPSPGKSFTFTFNAATGSSCSAISCHSDGTGVATGQLRNKDASTPWGGAALTCTSCHANPPDYANKSPKANSHSAHSAYSCYRCHSSSVSPDGQYAYAPSHGNGMYDVSGTNLSYTYQATGGTCTNSCHRYTSTWGGPPTACTSCHGYPGWPWTRDSYNTPNVHERHTNQCETCHVTVTTDGTSIVDRSKHANGVVDVQANGVVLFNYSSGQVGRCSAISCHGPDRKSVRWKLARSVASSTDYQNVPIADGYIIGFQEDMNWSTINPSTFFVTGVEGHVVTDPARLIATFVPNQPLSYARVYTLNVTDAIQNAAGDRLPYSSSWEFTTEKSTVPIRTETFGTVAAPSFTVVTSSCPSGACWSINSTDLNLLTTPAVADPFVTVSASTSGTDAQLISQPVDLTNYRSAVLKFQIYLIGFDPRAGGTTPDIDLDVSTSGAGGPWTTVWSKWYISTYYPFAYYYSADLTSIASGKSNVVFRFRYYNTYPSAMMGCAVDNIQLRGDPLPP